MQAHATYTNGASRLTSASQSARAVAQGAEPLEAVLGMGRAGRGALVAVLLAVALHASAAARAAVIPADMERWTKSAASFVHDLLTQTDIDVVVTKEPEPPPLPPPVPEEPVKEAPPPPVAVAAKAVPNEPEPPPPPPAAAEAAAILAAEPDPNEPVDLTNSFVTGTGSTFAGGTTQAGGTSKTAVYNPNARAGGVPGGTGTAVAPPAPAVDRSRVASCGGDVRWDCPFPPEADTAQIEEASVMIRASVNADGTVSKVDILQDPGNGFGREAKRCALTRKCEPALDASGRAIPGTSKTIRVRFNRD